ncbi:hypothetical protein GG681_10970 [Epibacterium sp. SM1969]|uniref:HTH luxR-type domain-containing protein n=1 Tax=Tritonibacter aquimaris TaxID=2663379 RepID=A0A844AYX0_9RHOB|nr:helix-turn-helix transcriptional regulator [Tritonibacter aquimaris]MQY43162.1 hypothetical protein [Tritonibacter aquimaris]
MLYTKLDYVEKIGTSKSVEQAGQVLLDVLEGYGANLVHAFMGTYEDSFRVTTMPDWAVKRDCCREDLLSSHTVKAVRSGVPRVIWGVDIDRYNPKASPVGIQMGLERWEHFRQRCGITFSMPDLDGEYRGAGVGLGYDDQAAQFLQFVKERGSDLALISFAAHSRLQFLLEKEDRSSPLSRRQAEILCFISQGEQISSIAHKLGITESTVNMHLGRLKVKLNVRTREQALAMALINKWIEP